MSDLKACPFCGRIPDIEDCGEHRWFIRCKCGIAQDKLFFQKCDAVRAWNKRKELRVKDTNVPITDTISRQAAIDAKQEFRNPNIVRDSLARTAFERTYANGWNDCNSAWIDAINTLPPAEPEQTYCEYCHEDSDGYVTPLEKNCHVVVECCPIDGWILSVKYGTWRKDVPIRYCPMCGRELKNG